MDSAGKAAIRPRTSAAELCFLGREADWLADKLSTRSPTANMSALLARMISATASSRRGKKPWPHGGRPPEKQ